MQGNHITVIFSDSYVYSYPPPYIYSLTPTFTQSHSTSRGCGLF